MMIGASPGRRQIVNDSTLPACITHPIGVAIDLLHGTFSIARGTLPLAIFGPENHAHPPSLVGALSRISQVLTAPGSACCWG
jgi:hypothetical protein